MALPDPKFAPQRPDLTFLRRRARPRREPAREPAGVDYVRHDKPAAAPATPAAPPAAAPPAPATPARGIDYSRHETARTSPAPAPAAPAAASAAAPDQPPRPRDVTPLPETPGHVVRVGGDRQQIMGERHPTVTLTRVQSGVGELRMAAVTSASAGDLRLGAVYQLRSGGSGVVALADGHRFGPSARRPVLVGSREEYEEVGLDLRQVDDIERIAVLAFSESRTELQWAGTLVLTLEGGARLEIPLDGLPAGRVAVLATVYNVGGELVVRAELDTIDGDIREAARAYGFDRITWRDDRHPAD